MLKLEFPETKTILGVSNVSFGLPAAGREVINSVFLYHCTQAGLDAAIVNTERLARYAEISDEERGLAEALLFVAPGDLETADRAVAALTAISTTALSTNRIGATYRKCRPRGSGAITFA